MHPHTAHQLLEQRRLPLIMGILNVTPDSFSDGGSYLSRRAIEEQVREMVEAGADILDVGGESTRPFSQPVDAEEELRRVIPAIEAIRRLCDLPVSIDTTKARVAREALAAGATIINDISALRFDPQMIKLAATSQVPVIIMHMQGTPRDMQLAPAYADVMEEISAFFSEQIARLGDQGVSTDRLIIDPGIGFGKTLEHNLTILKHLDALERLGCPVLVGHSRKAFIGKILDIAPPRERDCATAVVAAYCALKKAAIVRVHDVRKTAEALRMITAIQEAP